MSGQTKLAAFSEGAPEPTKPVFNCWTCLRKLDVIMLNGQQKVRCRARGLQDFQEYCRSWSDGNDLAHWPELPEGFVPKKYGGRT